MARTLALLVAVVCAFVAPSVAVTCPYAAGSTACTACSTAFAASPVPSPLPRSCCEAILTYCAETTTTDPACTDASIYATYGATCYNSVCQGLSRTDCPASGLCEWQHYCYSVSNCQSITSQSTCTSSDCEWSPERLACFLKNSNCDDKDEDPTGCAALGPSCGYFDGCNNKHKNDCPFTTATTSPNPPNPCTVAACENAASPLNADCCSAVDAYCAFTNDPGCANAEVVSLRATCPAAPCPYASGSAACTACNFAQNPLPRSCCEALLTYCKTATTDPACALTSTAYARYGAQCYNNVCRDLTESQCPASGLCSWQHYCYSVSDCQSITSQSTCTSSGCEWSDERLACFLGNSNCHNYDEDPTGCRNRGTSVCGYFLGCNNIIENGGDGGQCPFGTTSTNPPNPCTVTACQHATAPLSAECCDAVNAYCAATHDAGCTTNTEVTTLLATCPAATASAAATTAPAATTAGPPPRCTRRRHGTATCTCRPSRQRKTHCSLCAGYRGVCVSCLGSYLLTSAGKCVTTCPRGTTAQGGRCV